MSNHPAFGIKRAKLFSHLAQTPKISTLLAVWMVLHVLDSSLTYMILREGGAEANPLVQFGLDQVGGWTWGAKLAGAYFSGLMLQKSDKWFKRFIGLYVLIAAWNALNLWSYTQQ